jgi:hypothetical protein
LLTRGLGRQVLQPLPGLLLRLVPVLSALPPIHAAIPSVLVEANTRFTHNGKPIHPGLVRLFESGWLSDSGRPVVVSVDVSAGARSNQFSDRDVTVREDNMYMVAGEDSWFAYRWAGQSSNHVHVLVVSTGGGGGSGVFTSLLFVQFQFHDAQGFSDGQRYAQLLLKLLGRQTLGDRDDAPITVLPDRVVVGKSRYRTSPLTIILNPKPSGQPPAAAGKQTK